jgi:hypothetical protein
MTALRSKRVSGPAEKQLGWAEGSCSEPACPRAVAGPRRPCIAAPVRELSDANPSWKRSIRARRGIDGSLSTLPREPLVAPARGLPALRSPSGSRGGVCAPVCGRARGLGTVSPLRGCTPLEVTRLCRRACLRGRCRALDLSNEVPRARPDWPRSRRTARLARVCSRGGTSSDGTGARLDRAGAPSPTATA